MALNYILTWGNDWTEDASVNLPTYFMDEAFMDEALAEKGEQVVTIIKVLANNVNSGYDNLIDRRIMERNGT